MTFFSAGDALRSPFFFPLALVSFVLGRGAADLGIVTALRGSGVVWVKILLVVLGTEANVKRNGGMDESERTMDSRESCNDGRQKHRSKHAVQARACAHVAR